MLGTGRKEPIAGAGTGWKGMDAHLRLLHSLAVGPQVHQGTLEKTLYRGDLGERLEEQGTKYLETALPEQQNLCEIDSEFHSMSPAFSQVGVEGYGGWRPQVHSACCPFWRGQSERRAELSQARGCHQEPHSQVSMCLFVRL